MLTEKKKTMLIITLTAIALLINISMLLGLILDKEASDSYNHFLYEIRIIFWGWLLIIALAAAAMGTTLHWKPGRVLFRRVIIFLSVVSIIFALLWLFGLIMISTLEF
jgi:hypothetical protein